MAFETELLEQRLDFASVLSSENVEGERLSSMHSMNRYEKCCRDQPLEMKFHLSLLVVYVTSSVVRDPVLAEGEIAIHRCHEGLAIQPSTGKRGQVHLIDIEQVGR